MTQFKKVGFSEFTLLPEIKAIFVAIIRCWSRIWRSFRNRLQSFWGQRDVVDSMMMTVLWCWWLFQCNKSVINMWNWPLRSKNCHQHTPSPTFITNIDVASEILPNISKFHQLRGSAKPRISHKQIHFTENSIERKILNMSSRIKKN